MFFSSKYNWLYMHAAIKRPRMTLAKKDHSKVES